MVAIDLVTVYLRLIGYLAFVPTHRCIGDLMVQASVVCTFT